MNNIKRELSIYLEGKELNEETIKNFVRTRFASINRNSFYNSIRDLNLALKDLGREDLYVDSSENITSCMKEVVLLDKEDVVGICETFINSIDKFIVYAIFSGIIGKEYKDLTNIKVEHIAKDFSYINVNGKLYHSDEYMKKILKKAVEEDSYDMNVRDTTYSICVYDYNMDSPYLIKVKPTKRNRMGLNPITKVGIQIRLKKLTEQLQGTKYSNVNLTGKLLYKSHIIYQMSLIDINWTISKVKQFLKVNDLIGDSGEIRRLFFIKYRK